MCPRLGSNPLVHLLYPLNQTGPGESSPVLKREVSDVGDRVSGELHLSAQGLGVCWGRGCDGRRASERITDSEEEEEPWDITQHWGRGRCLPVPSPSGAVHCVCASCHVISACAALCPGRGQSAIDCACFPLGEVTLGSQEGASPHLPTPHP